MAPYDAILAYDWLKNNSPMTCDWNNKTLEFTHKGILIKLQGLLPPPLTARPISATKLYNTTKGNDAWAFAIVTTTESALSQTDTANNQVPSCIQQVLDQHSQVFQDPQTLPLSRSYNHAIPLIPGAVPMNARPYHYSPQLKT